MSIHNNNNIQILTAAKSYSEGNIYDLRVDQTFFKQGNYFQSLPSSILNIPG